MGSTSDKGPPIQRPRAQSESLLSPPVSSSLPLLPTQRYPYVMHLPEPPTPSPQEPSPIIPTSNGNDSHRTVYQRFLHYTRLLFRSITPSICRWLILTLTVSLSLYTLHQLYQHRRGEGDIGDHYQFNDDQDAGHRFLHEQHILLRPHNPQATQKVGKGGKKTHHYKHDSPEQWLRENSFHNFDQGFVDDDEGEEEYQAKVFRQISRRPRAALISLVRNEELEGILQSMQQLELHWNRRFGYPWIFFNERPFSDEFKVSDLVPVCVACPLFVNKRSGILVILPLTYSSSQHRLQPVTRRPPEPNTTSFPGRTGRLRHGSPRPATWTASTTLAPSESARDTC